MLERFFFYKKDNKVKACFTDYVVKTVSSHALEGDVFDDEYIIQSIKRDKQLRLFIGVKPDVIEEIYQQIKLPERLISVVPYGMALVALLKDKGVDLTKTLIFIDYQIQGVLLTIIDRDIFHTPRVISDVDKDQVMREVERTVKHYVQMNKHLHEEDIRILSNEQIGIEFPAISGMQIASFDIHFDVPSRIIAAKKKSFLIKRLMNIGVCLLFLCIGITAIVCVEIKQHQAQQRYRRLEQVYKQKKIELANVMKDKIYSQIKEEFKLDLQSVYLKLNKKAPLGTRLTFLSLAKIEDSAQWAGKVHYQIRKDVVVRKKISIDLGLENEKNRFVNNDQYQHIEVVFNLSEDIRNNE